MFREHPRKPRRGTQLRPSGTLPPSDLYRSAETSLRFGNVRRVLSQQQLTSDVVQMWTDRLLSGPRGGSKSFLQHLKSFLRPPDPSQPGGQQVKIPSLRGPSGSADSGEAPAHPGDAFLESPLGYLSGAM